MVTPGLFFSKNIHPHTLAGGTQIVLEMENKKGSRLKVCLKGKIDFDPMDIARTFLQKNL